MKYLVDALTCAPHITTQAVKPLNDLQKDKSWVWTEECSQAMNSAKQLLTTSSVLTHYDPSSPLKLAADASQYGLGAVISHSSQWGRETDCLHLSFFIPEWELLPDWQGDLGSHLWSTQVPQLPVWPIVYTGDGPQATYEHPWSKKGVPSVAAARLRWALLLAAYDYDIEFRPMNAHSNADALSRLPLPLEGSQAPSETRLCNIRKIEALPVASMEIRTATQRDPTLSKVKRYVLRGWPEEIPKALQTYHSKIAELSVEDGFLIWGGRVVIPPSLRGKIKVELHKEHLGISRMKALARNHVWWPRIDKELESLVKSCPDCAAVKQMPAKAPLHPWNWPTRPWERIHIDFAGPFMNKSFFIVVDA